MEPPTSDATEDATSDETSDEMSDAIKLKRRELRKKKTKGRSTKVITTDPANDAR